MADGGGGGRARELDQTPTWAVSMVCGVIIIISVVLESLLHLIAKLFSKRRKHAMLEALEKIKAELMILGFISLLLTFGQNYIATICIPRKVANTMLPCPKPESRLKNVKHHLHGERGRVLMYEHRFLGGNGIDHDAGCTEGLVPLISSNGLHQLHIFIFFLAVFHVFYSAITMMLGRLKIRRWKEWEQEAQTEQKLMNDPRLTHETSFVRHNTFNWRKSTVIFYVICFLKQFIGSVHRADYQTMRHGFINVHLAPGSNFDFRKYIKRSLEDDFKVVVGISPLLWTSMLVFLLLNVHGWQIMHLLSFFPLVVILAVGTKLQGIKAQMAFEITEKQAIIHGLPLVQVSDSYFWFSKPQLILHMIHFVLFQNAFEITYFLWIWYEFGLRSCFHEEFEHVVVRIALGIAVQFMCSYITLPLYALVTQMGSNMKRSIFDEQTSKALKKWHKQATEKLKQNSRSNYSFLSRYHFPSTRTLGKPSDSIRIQPLSASPTLARIGTTNSEPTTQTAITMASVDLINIQDQNSKGPPQVQKPPDLL